MNQKRYWLRGGGIAVILGLILAVTPLYKILDYISKPFFYLIPDFTPFLFDGEEDIVWAILFYYLLALVWMFIIGSILGWLYGKFKNRNKMI